MNIHDANDIIDEFMINSKYSSFNSKVEELVKSAIKRMASQVTIQQGFDPDDDVELDKPEVTKTAKSKEPICTCESLDLFRFGCKCGAVEPYDGEKLIRDKLTGKKEV